MEWVSLEADWRNKTFLMGQLLDICSECTEDCWDGYDAVAVNTKTLLAAKNFISLLPDNIEYPDIVPEPSGEIGFEWSKKGLRFLVSIDSETMIYAGVFGEEITHGERKFNNKLPDNIKNTLVEYFKVTAQA